MPKGDSVFDKWFDRFNRGMVSKYGKLRIFLFRGTFDRLRRVTRNNEPEEANEEEILEMLRSLLVNVYTPSEHKMKKMEKWRVVRGSLPKKTSDTAKITGDHDVETDEEISAAYVRPIEFHHKAGGFVMLFPPSSKFLGEISSDSQPVVIQYVDKSPAWAEKRAESIIPRNFGVLPPEATTAPLEDGENFFNESNLDFRECKIFPTDVLLESVHRERRKGWWGLEKADRDRFVKEDIDETLHTLRRQLAEIRVTNSPGEASEEQAKAMDTFLPGDNPMLNVTGRPGTGKTTVTQVSAAEACLYQNKNLKIMYLTTTGNLKSEAVDEISSIIRNVYKAKNPEEKLKKIDFFTRDELIQELPQTDSRLESDHIKMWVEEIIEEKGGKPDFKKKEGQKTLKQWREWSEQSGNEELFQIIQNFVFGVFGSVQKFINWFNQTPGRCGFKRRDYERWKDIFFSKRNWNFIDPENELLLPGSDQFPLYRIWNPYPKVRPGRMNKGDWEDGYKKISHLKDLLSEESFSSRLFGKSLDGKWTHAAVLDHLASMVGDDQIKRFNTPLWRSRRNDYDVIMFDESQDFTIREVACVLKIFAKRGSGSPVDTYRPFSLICAGDPLQTIEGSIFNARNSHLNAVYVDWKESISISGSDRGLKNPIHLELKANYRNSKAIVEGVLNPIIREMNSFDRRTIGEQRPAFDHKGLVLQVSKEDLTKSDEEVEHESNGRKRNERIQKREAYKIALNRLQQQLIESCGAKKEQKLTSRATVALILPSNIFKRRDELIKCLDRHGILNYKNPDKEAGGSASGPYDGLTIGELIEELLKGDEYDEDGESASYRRALDRAGIYHIEAIKGRTVGVAIVLEFADNAIKALNESKGITKGEDNISDSDTLLKLSHLLVASSRPQYALFLHGPSEMNLNDLNIDIDKMGFEGLHNDSLKRLITESQIDYNPSAVFVEALYHSFKNQPDSINESDSRNEDKGAKVFWGFAENAAEGARKGQDIVKLARNIHLKFSRGQYPWLISEMQKIGKDKDNDKRYSESAKEIGQSSIWIYEDDDDSEDSKKRERDSGPVTTRKQLLQFFTWKNFIEDAKGLVPSSNDVVYRPLANWVEWLIDPSIDTTSDLLGVEGLPSRWSFTPFRYTAQVDGIDDGEAAKFGKVVNPRRPGRDDCPLSVMVPPRWVFAGMKMEGVWTPDYTDFKKAVDEALRRYKSNDPEFLRSKFIGLWFLACSHLEKIIQSDPHEGIRDGLRKVAEDAIKHGRERAKEAIRDGREIPSYEKMGNNVIHWMLHSSGMDEPDVDEAVLEELAYWCRFDEVNFNDLLKMAFIDYIKDTMGGEANMAYSLKSLASFMAKEKDLKSFWISLIEMDEFKELAEDCYEKILIQAENESEYTSQIVDKLEQLHRAIDENVKFNSKIDSSMENSDLRTRIRSVHNLITGLEKSKGRHRGSGADSAWPSLLFRPQYSDILKSYPEWKMMTGIFQDWMKSTTGGELGSLKNKINKNQKNIIHSLMMPLSKNILKEEMTGREREKYEALQFLHKGELLEFGRKQCNHYLNLVYSTMYSTAGSNTISELNHEVMKFIIGISLGKKNQEKWGDVDVLSVLSQNFEESLTKRYPGEKSGPIYRQSNNFWNYVGGNELRTNRKYGIELSLKKTRGIRYGDLRRRIPDPGATFREFDPKAVILDNRFARVPLPSILESGWVNPFCNNNAGIAAYCISSMESDDALSESDLVNLRSLFRRAGNYREAAIVDLALCVLGHREQKDMIKMALEERAGIFHDQILINSLWENNDSRLGSDMPDPLADRFSLSFKENSLRPNVPSQIRTGDALKFLNLIGGNHYDSALLTKMNEEGSSMNSRKAINIIEDWRYYDRFKDQEKIKSIQIELDRIVVSLTYSTRTLLPYLLLSLEVANACEIEDIRWFETPAPNESTRENTVEGRIVNVSRDSLIEEIKEQDQWLYSLYEVHMKGEVFDGDRLLEALSEEAGTGMTEIGRPFTQDVLGNVARTCLGITKVSKQDSLGDIATEENGTEGLNDWKKKFGVMEDSSGENYRSNLNELQDSIKNQSVKECNVCSKDISLVLELGGVVCPYCKTSLIQ